MDFALGKLVGLLIEPGNALLLTLFAGWVMTRTKLRRWGRGLIAFVVTAFVAITVTPVANWTAAVLENRFADSPALPPVVDGIIVLGGSFSLDVSEARGEASLNHAAGRLVKFAELARRYPKARLVFSGGSGELFPGLLTESQLARRVFRQMGLDASRMIYEPASRTTWENARNSYRLIEPRAEEVWVLITSAMHMPRAVGSFRRVGWQVHTFPVAYRTAGLGFGNYRVGLSSNLDLLRQAIHEWVGLVAYYLLDRSSALFPDQPV